MTERVEEREITCECESEIGVIVAIKEDGKIVKRYFKSKANVTMQMKRNEAGLYVDCPECGSPAIVEAIR